MAIIYSYPESLQVLATDLLLGTSTIKVAGKKKNITKNFTVETLGLFIQDNYPTVTPNLDQVLTSGNTSLLNASIGELGIWDPANNAYLKVIGGDNSFTFKRSNLESIFTIEQGVLALYQTNLISGNISTSTLTATRVYSLPNASGTIALTSDIPVESQNLNDVLTIGNTSILDAKVGSLGLYDVEGFDYATITAYDHNFTFKDYNGDYVLYTEQGNLSLYKTNTIAAGISSNLLTASRSYALPDMSGTIALTSDIPIVNIPTLDQVLTAGNFSIIAACVGKVGLFDSINPSNYGYLSLDNSVFSSSDFENQIFFEASENYLRVYRKITGVYGNIDFSNISSNRNYILPNNSGTIALTSDIPVPITLTTTGSSGVATLIGSTLNIPNYSTDLSGYVPYTGATSNVNLGIYDITASHLIKDGGVSSQFLKADGSVDNNVYLTSTDLPSTLDLFATTTADPIIPGYAVLVRNILDSRYNTVAVNVPTGAITTTNQLLASLITDTNVISGNPGVFNFTTVGNIQRISGTGQAEFYFRIYKRDLAGIETFITQSNNTLPVLNTGYSEFSAVALWNDGVFLTTDRIVIKYYGSRLASPVGSTPYFQFQFGGLTPVRSVAPVPVAVLPNIYLSNLADVEDVDPLPNEVLYWNDTANLWEHSLVLDLLSPASSSVNGYLTSTDWNIFNGKGNGTVTSVAALTLGTSGTDLSSTVANGSTAPVITLNIPTASAANRGVLSSANWTTFNNKQDTITGAATTITTSNLTASRVLVSDASGKVAANAVTTTTLGYLDATSSIQTQLNAKQGTLTLTTTGTSGASTLVGNTLNIPQYSGGSTSSGIHAVIKPSSGQSVGVQLTGTSLTTAGTTNGRVVVMPFVPYQTITCQSLMINVAVLGAGVNGRILIYSDLNGKPNTKIYESANLDCSTTGQKFATTTQTFNAGTTYWIGTQFNGAVTTSANASTLMIPVAISGVLVYTSLTTSAAFGSAPDPFGTPTLGSSNVFYVGIVIA